MRLRVQVQATDDPASAAYVLRYQKNGSGGYVAVPVGASVAEAYGTVTFQSIGTGANGSTTVAPSYPASIAAGDYLVAIVTSGSTGDATPTDSGSKWTLLATGASSDGSYGVDTGPRRVTAFGCIADGTESGTYTFNISGGGTCRGTISRFTKAGSGSWDIEAAGANDSTSGTGVSMTFATMNWNTGDAVLVATGQRVDSATQSAQSLSASGVTFGTRTNRAATAVTTGNDHRHSVDTFAAISSTSDVDAAATWSYTASAAASAGGVVVRLREYTAPVTNEIYVATSSNITDGGATTQQLSTGSGTFDAGQIVDASNSITLDIGNNRYTELEWNLATQSPAVDTDYFDFRVYAAGSALDTYTDTPRWTIGGGATNVALSGQSVTVSAGTLAHTHSVALGGQAVTASAGTLTPSTSIALTGQAATASAGTLIPDRSIALTGAAVTASAGTLASERSIALTGTAVTVSAGTLTASIGADLTLALTGQAVAASAGTLTPSTSIALTGQSATASTGTLTLSRAVLLSGSAVTASPGTLTPSFSISLSGQAVTASAGTLTPSTTIGLTGTAVTASAGTITAQAGSNVTVALSGTAVTASAGTLAVSVTFPLTGQAVAASAGTLAPETSKALSGQAVAASAGTLTSARSIALTGTAVAAEAGTLVASIPGDKTIALTGEVVTVSAGTITASVPGTEIPEGARGGGGGGSHRGWSEKEDARKRKRDKDLEDAIRKMYRDLTQDPDTAEAAGEIVAPIAPKSAGPVPKPAVVAFNRVTDEIETGIRVLHRELAAIKQARDDEENEAREIMEILELID